MVSSPCLKRKTSHRFEILAFGGSRTKSEDAFRPRLTNSRVEWWWSRNRAPHLSIGLGGKAGVAKKPTIKCHVTQVSSFSPGTDHISEAASFDAGEVGEVAPAGYAGSGLRPALGGDDDAIAAGPGVGAGVA